MRWDGADFRRSRGCDTLLLMSRPILEVIALDAADAVAAQAGGADRLELVVDMAADGLTPSVETFTSVREAVDLPLRVMLRSRDGFTSGGPDAVRDLAIRARRLREAGATEFVLGFLDESGGPDLPTVQALLAELDGCRWTFHRAIDRAADRETLRKELADLPGLDTYLTAGSARGVDDGLPTLCAEAARSIAGEPGHRPTLLVGGGLQLKHLPALRRAGLAAFHIGGAARPGGWDAPVDADAVRGWRVVLDAPLDA
ncbi:copper homeostasis protein CutC [Streptomyces sp. OF8]|uniref:Copper homeostasis protein cutC homolog n=2 Tax=Streptomyces alkaliterrae TaxID=2213162 RepID=A0A5P0YYL7_9ACTN|nr:copper homeostasis protein CutC [Streptomyces alkaliterrae]MQS05394.1 copper homeostasis protein CutC [Streptomyces alkaliterrae]